MTCAPLHPRQHNDKLPSTPISLTNPTQLANLEIGAGNPAAAIPLLEAYLADKTNDARAWIQLAKALRTTSGVSRAVGIMRCAVSAIPDDPFLWHFYADLTGKTSGPYRARQLLRHALTRCKESAVLYCACAVAESELSNRRAAIPLFESASRLDPTDPITYLKWASAEQANRKFDHARLVYQQGIRLVPKRSLPVLYTAYAGMEANGRRYDAARSLYRLAAECNPKDKLVWQPWACMEQRAGNLDRARELFERAVLADPTFTSCWQAWGLLEQRAGNLDSARALFERGTHADPDDFVCWQAWATLEAENDNVVEARRLFAEGAQRVLERGRAAPLYLAWGRTEEAAGDLDLARQCFRTALDRTHEKLSDKVIISHTWAGMEHRARNIEGARQLYAKVSQLNRRDFRSLYAWGMMELEESNYDTARKLLTKCVRIAPRDKGAIQALGKLEFQHFAQSDGAKKARHMLKRATGQFRHNTSLLKFWASLEKEHGDPQLAQRLQLSVDQDNGSDA